MRGAASAVRPPAIRDIGTVPAEGVPLEVVGEAGWEAVGKLVEAGLAHPPAGGRLALTAQGRLVADSVAVELW